MRHTKKKHVPAREEDVYDYTSCDVCHKKIDTDDGLDRSEVTVRSSYSSGDGSYITGHTDFVDLCEYCFDSIIVKAIEAAGGKMQTCDF